MGNRHQKWIENFRTFHWKCFLIVRINQQKTNDGRPLWRNVDRRRLIAENSRNVEILLHSSYDEDNLPPDKLNDDQVLLQKKKSEEQVSTEKTDKGRTPSINTSDKLKLHHAVQKLVGLRQVFSKELYAKLCSLNNIDNYIFLKKENYQAALRIQMTALQRHAVNCVFNGVAGSYQL